MNLLRHSAVHFVATVILICDFKSLGEVRLIIRSLLTPSNSGPHFMHVFLRESDNALFSMTSEVGQITLRQLVYQQAITLACEGLRQNSNHTNRDRSLAH